MVQVMNSLFRKAGVILLGIAMPVLVHSQDNADSAVLRYLRTKPDIPAPFLKVVRKGNKGVRSQNYFNEPNEPIKNDSITFTTYLFGSSASHNRKYFLIEIKTTSAKMFKIIDDDNLEDGIKSLFAFLAKYHLSDSKKAVFVNQLTYTYY